MKIYGVVETVQRRLRQAIITGKLPPDHKLNEIELAQEFEVSRPPLREAFRKLENENLIVSIPRKGSYVAGMSKEDCEQIYRVRVMLECAAVDIIGEQGITDLSATHESLSSGVEFTPPADPTASDMLAYFQVMATFHNQLVKACRNKWIIHYHEQLRSCLARYQVIYLRIPGTRQASLNEHDKVLELIRNGDYQQAKEKLSRHIMLTRDALISRIQETALAD